MDAVRFFDSEKYFSSVCAANRLAADNGFRFCTCSGIESLQGPLDRFKTDSAFFCLDDTNDGALVRGRGGGWYKKRTFTVFILHRYTSRSNTLMLPKYRNNGNSMSFPSAYTKARIRQTSRSSF